MFFPAYRFISLQLGSFFSLSIWGEETCRREKAEKEGKTIGYTEKQLSLVDADSSFSIKSRHHGYKLSTKVDTDYELIRTLKPI